MKLYDFSLIIVIIVIAATVIGGSSYYFLGPDNPVEVAAEDVIKAETGVNVDLSPSNGSTESTTTPATTKSPCHC